VPHCGGPTRRAEVSPDRRRAQDEAVALRRWQTEHVPAVLADDAALGALLLEAVEPGAPLDESRTIPRTEALASLLTSLHHPGGPLPVRVRPVAKRIEHLYEAGRRNYDRRPDLAAVIPPDLYERGRRLAMRLAGDVPAAALLHGDLTPANLLDGGERGLVAIDPAPCVGDPAFDAVDLLLWQAEDAPTLATRVDALAPAIEVGARRLHQWCAAFAAMTALELAEASSYPRRTMGFLVDLAGAET
jgi:streptomycin 6-kinase